MTNDSMVLPTALNADIAILLMVKASIDVIITQYRNVIVVRNFKYVPKPMLDVDGI